MQILTNASDTLIIILYKQLITKKFTSGKDATFS